MNILNKIKIVLGAFGIFLILNSIFWHIVNIFNLISVDQSNNISNHGDWGPFTIAHNLSLANVWGIPYIFYLLFGLYVLFKSNRTNIIIKSTFLILGVIGIPIALYSIAVNLTFIRQIPFFVDHLWDLDIFRFNYIDAIDYISLLYVLIAVYYLITTSLKINKQSLKSQT